MKAIAEATALYLLGKNGEKIIGNTTKVALNTANSARVKPRAPQPEIALGFLWERSYKASTLQE